MVVNKAGEYCTYHEEKEQRADGQKVRCSKIKTNDKQCGNKTANKSCLCYIHD